eukprot:scaffold11036_cov44-Phaeocystis_antarctica.AAC.2
MRRPLVDRSGQRLTSLRHAFPVVGAAVAYFAHPVYLQYVYSGQTNYMTVKPTHGAYHPTRSPAPGTAWGRMLAI